jgi:hypothetical protein
VTVSLEVSRMIAKLPSLTKEDRAALRGALLMLGGAESSPPGDIAFDWLLDGILYELKRRGLPYPGFTLPRLRALAPNYVNESVPIRVRLAQATGVGKNQTERLLLGRLVAGVLIDHLIETGPNRPLGLKVVLTNVGQTFEALENAFPGYLENWPVWLLGYTNVGPVQAG